MPIAIGRRGDDYYIAPATFEWFPGLAVCHSRDLMHWRIITHVLTDENTLDLRRLPLAKGFWAPCLAWCESELIFFVLYTRMVSHNARFFDQGDFLVTAPEITGPWCEPVCLHSVGIGPSLLHDDDGAPLLVQAIWSAVALFA
jgi:xylan 1,4-beta-xylosidase